MITYSQLGRNGRMSNQLFQIAATIGIAIKNNEPYLFPSWEYEPYFNLHGCFSNNLPKLRTVQEPHFHYANLPPMKNEDLSGYWQSAKYFEHCADFIRQAFEFKQPIPTQNNITSIHVRRGDYVNLSQFHTDLAATDYYERAMAILPSKNYFVFSDDINFCKQRFKGSQFTFMENTANISDFMLMARCENNIICNSSFSWWAAYLNKNPNKKVVAPLNWFGPQLPHNIKDLLCPEWIKI